MSIIPKQNLVGYWPLDGHALDMRDNEDVIAFDAATDGGYNGGASTSLTWSHTCSGFNRILFVQVEETTGASSKVTGVTYGGVAMTMVPGSNILAATTRWNSTWYLYNPATGANNIVATISSNDVIVGIATSYSGVRQSSGIESVVVSNLGTTGLTTLTVNTTTVANNCWLIEAVLGTGPVTAGSGTTSRKVNNTDGGVALMDSNGAKTPPGSYGLTYNQASGKASGVLISLAPGRTKYSNNGTVTGALPVPSQNPAIPASLAYKFVKASTQSITSASNLGIAGTNLTMSIWAKHASLPGTTPDEATWHGIFGLSSAASTYIQNVIVLRNVSSTIKLAFYRSRSGITNDGPEYTFTPKLNNWYLYTMTYDGSTVKGYINGIFVGSASSSGNGSAGSGNETAIGKWGGGANYYFDGNLQEAAIFNKALSDQEIQAIYNQSKRKYTSKGWLSGVITAIRTSDFFQFFFN